jgi:hypothetical protein
MTTPRGTGVAVERARASLTGLYVALVGVIILNAAVFLDWASREGATGGFSGYESDSLWPFVAYLGVGFILAMLYAAKRAYRRQHRGLSLASMAVALAVVLQCLAWGIDIPGAAERQSELNDAYGVWVGLVGAALWSIGSGLLARDAEGDVESDRVSDSAQYRGRPEGYTP